MTANSKENTAKADHETDVLYQKLGERWFAFSIVNDEVFMSPVTEQQIEEIRREETLDATVAASFHVPNDGSINNA